MIRILIIEDDIGIADALRRGLEQAQYYVEIARRGDRGLERTRLSEWSAIILDIMLPGLDGWEICEAIRSEGNNTPILMLTAKGGVNDRVRGLETGADDYLPKPFEFVELMARIKALIRRDKVHKSKIIRVADMEIDTGARRVKRNGIEVPLSHREYDLLEALASHEGHVLSRETIQERIWMDEDSLSNTVDVYIGLLRKKIDQGHRVKLIQTIRGAGYSLRPAQSDSRET